MGLDFIPQGTGLVARPPRQVEKEALKLQRGLGLERLACSADKQG